MKEPQPFSGDRAHYREWRENLHAYLNAHDPLYVQLLLWLEELGRRAFRPDDLVDLVEDMQLKAEDAIEAKNSLFTFLCSYTSGTAKRTVRRQRAKGVFESYRKLHFEGMRPTPKNAFLDRASLWKVEEVAIDKVEDALEAWEERL